MMQIEIGKKKYDLKTCLGVAVKLEKEFKKPLTRIMQSISEADISEMLDIIGMAASADESDEIASSALENWDFSDIQGAVNELLIRLSFSGSPDQIEKKLAKHPGTEEQKNAIREMLGLPLKNTSTENSLSEPVTE